MVDYRDTLNLPKTDFPMRANLPVREPEILARWQEMGLERLVREGRCAGPTYVLHDGPPYSNGHIHMGTVLNKTLKDVVNKYWTSKGRFTPYIPGWDTHGLPIERAVLTEMGNPAEPPDPVTLRAACRAYALNFIALMTGEFKRLGVRGAWDEPYMTLDPVYEAEEIRVFGAMHRKGLIKKDFKSVNWCPECRTALAEAEIEYKEVTSPSLYVAFPVTEPLGPLEAGDALVAWTTTPWTLPGNQAVALAPDVVYVRSEGPGGAAVLSEKAHERLREVLGLGAVLGRFRGREVEGARVAQPVFDRSVPVILGEHVTEEEGTGVVHTAPAHGEEDFEVGRRYGLPIGSPVDGRGIFTEEAGPFEGLDIREAYPQITALLRQRGRLVREEPFRHSYPHCWRSKGPIIFRATEQWFFSISDLRPEILDAISKVRWEPGWGETRMRRMTEDRGEWCISRQRVWGLPIPALYCEGCGQIVVDEVNEIVAARVAEAGSDVWWTDEAAAFLPEGFRCPACGASSFRKETDTLDVWFDSGSSNLAVLESRGLPWPADLYVEGSDQFRGWFNSSLTAAVAVKGEPPYRAVLTHGYVLDELGDKMSKSVGNVITPSDLLDRYGADILRLWATSSDFKSDVSVSFSILDQVAEGYRKLRNTLRFILGNLADFDPSSPLATDLPPFEAWILRRTAEVARKVDDAYQSFDLHVVYHQVLNLATVDLSNFYLDVRKDLLYCAHPDEGPRRASQKTLEIVGRALLGMIAPILTFTSEEVWGHFPHRKGDPATVQLLPFPDADSLPGPAEGAAVIDDLLPLREVAMKALEEARAAKLIGGSLEASVTLEADGEAFARLKGREALLETLLVVSKVVLKKGDGLAVKVAPAEGSKCGRCWRIVPEVGTHPAYPDLCPRCEDAVTRLLATRG